MKKMPKRKIEKTPFYSYKIGALPKGCQLCVKGEKLVLFVTGLCGMNCYYCPISDKKKNKDDVYANEWKISKARNIIEEAALCSAKGAGITGGDPLFRLQRAIEYIQMLKQVFGKDFHIHLYTPLHFVSKEKLQQLYDAGLDEIRFHPNLDNDDDWKRINFAMNFDWDVGVEIPVIPTKKRSIMKLINYVKNRVKFLNLNELELSDTNSGELLKRKFKTKSQLSYAVKGSEELAIELLEYCKRNTSLDVHYCTATLKDKVQLANRIKKRAKNAAKKYDKITKEGMLIRGAIYLKELQPKQGYRKKLEEIEQNHALKIELLKRLEQSRNELIKKAKLPKTLLEIDTNKLRILTSKQLAQKNKEKIKKLNLIPAVVEEYPTYDALEIDVLFL